MGSRMFGGPSSRACFRSWVPLSVGSKQPLSTTRCSSHRLFDAAKRALGADGRPRLLIVDDLQWCDAGTIDFIGFIVSTSQAAPILIVGTVRSEEVPDGHPLTALTEALDRDRAVTTLPLGRFDRSDTATLASPIATRRRARLRRDRSIVARDRGQSTVRHRNASRSNGRRCGRGPADRDDTHGARNSTGATDSRRAPACRSRSRLWPAVLDELDGVDRGSR